MLDFLLVLILFFLAVYSSTLAWVPLPAVAAVSTIRRPGAALIWLPVAPADVHGRDTAQTECTAWAGPTGAGSAAGPWGGPRSAHNRGRKSVLNWRTRFPPFPAAGRRNLNRGENRS